MAGSALAVKGSAAPEGSGSVAKGWGWAEAAALGWAVAVEGQGWAEVGWAAAGAAEGVDWLAGSTLQSTPDTYQRDKSAGCSQ